MKLPDWWNIETYTPIQGILKFPVMTEDEQANLRLTIDKALEKAQEEALLKARELAPIRTGGFFKVEPASHDPQALGPVITCQVCGMDIGLNWCVDCGTRICDSCVDEVKGDILCPNCVEERAEKADEEKAEEEEEDDEPLLIRPEGWEKDDDDPTE